MSIKGSCTARASFISGGIFFLLFIACCAWLKFKPSSGLVLDQSIYEYSLQGHTALLDIIANALTLLGDKKVVLPAIGIYILVLLVQKQWRLALHWFALCIITVLCVSVSKHWVASLRPNMMTSAMGEFSFPSGHATLATAWLGFLYTSVAPQLTAAKRIIWLLLSLLLSIAVMASRLYFGVHWFSDVAGGFLLGVSLTLLVSGIYWLKPSKKSFFT